jgi:hypothetical protein
VADFPATGGLKWRRHVPHLETVSLADVLTIMEHDAGGGFS